MLFGEITKEKLGDGAIVAIIVIGIIAVFKWIGTFSFTIGL